MTSVVQILWRSGKSPRLD